MTTLYPVAPYGQQTWGGYWKPTLGVTADALSALRVQMYSRSRDYNELIIGWNQPLDSYDSLALVRNTYGPPLTLTDGTLVYQATSDAVINRFFEDVGLTGGHWYSYSLFLHLTAATPHWQRVGAITAFVAENYGTGDDLFEMLPLFYQADDAGLVNSEAVHLPLVQYVGEGPLQRFLNLIGYKFDEIRTEATNGLEVFSPETLRADALLSASLTYGFPYEPYIGWRQVRLLWQNWAYILKTKGTKLGIEAFASAFTGYGATAYLSKNLMLDSNASEALVNIQQWFASGITIARDVGYTLATPTGPTPYGTTVANFLVTCKSGGGPQDNTIHNGGLATGRTVRNTGVPVDAGLFYAYSFGAQAKTTQRNIVARIAWYDATGTFISNSDGTPMAEAVFNSSPPWLLAGVPVRPFVVAAAPTNAVYAIPEVIIQAAANSEQHFLTAFQFEVVANGAALPTFYETAREIYIVLEANRINISQNPSLENDDDNWISDSNCVVQRNANFAYSGANSLRARSIVAGDFSFAYALSYVFAEHDLYTFSVFIRQHNADLLAGAQAYATMRWYGLSDTATPYPVLLATQVGLTTIDIPNLSWSSQPVSVTAQAPAGAVSAQGVITVTNAPPANLRVFVDAAMWEKNGGINPYFDGDTDPSSGEYLWEGTAGSSSSHHYSGKPLRNTRFQTLLPDFLPAFSSWRVLYAQPSS